MKTFSAIAIIAALLISSCGQDQTAENNIKPTVSEEKPSRPVPFVSLPEGDHPQEWEDIRLSLEDALVRLAYHDKTGLWENEFPYLHDQETVDKYIRRGEISWANVDSLLGVEINSISIVADTATVMGNFVFLNADGNPKKSPTSLPLFRINDRWIKPYVSDLLHQREYEDLIRKSIEDSKEDW